jgi:hypothetical protein
VVRRTRSAAIALAVLAACAYPNPAGSDGGSGDGGTGNGGSGDGGSGSGSGGSGSGDGGNGSGSGKIVFVTSQTFNGSMSGLAGADSQCQELAGSAGLSGTYKAWLSAGSSSAASRMTQSSEPYVLVNGSVVAENFAALTDTSSTPLVNAIARDEHGDMQVTYAWTNTNADGSLSYADTSCNDCAGWTNAAETSCGSGSSYAGAFGSNAAQVSEWTQLGLQSCGSAAALYCIEQ